MTDSNKAAALPLFYKEPVAIDSNLHRDMTVSPSPKGYAFAAEASNVILSAVEFFDACRDYPIIFSPAEDGTVIPTALLGIQTGENLYLDAAGVWKANYIPAYIRRYPFILADTGAAEFPICIDKAFDGLNIEGGQRLFSEDGEQTDYCRHIQGFIRDYQVQTAATAEFAARLRELDLLRPMDANIGLKDGTKFVVQGFLIVDENSLGRLGDVVVQELFRKGYLGLIYAHLVSIKNLARMIDWKAELPAAATEPAETKEPAKPEETAKPGKK